MAMKKKERINFKSVASLVFGILSVSLEEEVGLVLGIIGIILYVKGKREIEQHQVLSKRVAIVGFICSIIGIAIQFLDIID